MTLPDFTFWQGTILFSLGTLFGGLLGWLVGEAHGWFRRQKFEEARKVVDEINRKNEEWLTTPIVVSMTQDIIPPDYEK